MLETFACGGGRSCMRTLNTIRQAKRARELESKQAKKSQVNRLIVTLELNFRIRLAAGFAFSFYFTFYLLFAKREQQQS